MKFLVSTVTKRGPRLGILYEIERMPGVNLETPMAMLYTRGGSIPHITNEVFKLVCKNSHIIQIPLVSTYNFGDAMFEFNGTISDFVGMKDCLSCVTVQDPADYTQAGHRVQDLVPLWTRQGKVLINARLYMNIVETFKPDMYYLLSDSDTNSASSAKRVSKAVNNTVTYFKQCMERHEQSKDLKNSFVMGTVAGGYCVNARQKCIDAVCSNPLVGGYLIDGLHNNGPEVELIKPEELTKVVEYINDKLPSDKLRAIHGCWNPVTLLHLIELGVDMFDTSYCYVVTERSCALTFSLDSSSKNDQYEINLRQPQFAEDFRPISDSCGCLTCAKYSRGYIHHLVTVQELLGPLLLTIHNIYHYMQFFEKIRASIKDGALSQLKERIALQFNAHQSVITKQKQTAAKRVNVELNSLQDRSAVEDVQDNTAENSENVENERNDPNFVVEQVKTMT